MSRAGGEIEFEFQDDASEEGSFVATGKVVPMLTTLLASGKVEEAMQLFEGCEAGVAADLIAQTKTMSSVSLKNLGAMFVLARDFGSAAKVYESGKKFGEAAKLYEQANDLAAASRCYEKDGNLGKVAALLERAGKGEEALEIHRKLGPTEEMAHCMSRQHRFWEAAQIYQHLGNVRSEVESLRLVPVASPDRLSAVKRLGDLMEAHGQLGQAAQLLIETAGQVPAALSDRELLAALVRRLETLGRNDQADRVRGFLQKLLGPGTPAAAQPQLTAATVTAVVTPVPAKPAPAPKPRPASADPFDTLVDPFGGGALPAASATVTTAVVTPRPANDGYGQLKAIPIFGELALPDMKDLHRISEPVNYPPGSTIIEHGVEGVGLVVILQGEVQVLRVDGATAVPLATLGAGSYVGELSLVDEAPTSARVQAKTPVRALLISRARFQQYLYTHEAASTRIYMLFTRTLAERLRQANKRS